MAHTARGYCWTSQDNMVDNSYRREAEPIINVPTLHSKPSVDDDMAYLARNARNGYTARCDNIMGLWRDGLSYLRVVELACEWLAKFNERSGVV